MSNEEINQTISTVIQEASEYGSLIYININFNFSGSTSTVNLTGEPDDEPPPPPGGS